MKHLDNSLPLLCVVGPTASGKSARAVSLAHEHNGEVISVDSRQVYRMLDIGTEKTSLEEMEGIPHHLIDILDPRDSYSAADFVRDTTRLITEIEGRGKRPILAGGTHFYFEALLYGLPETSPVDYAARALLETLSTEELVRQIQEKDPRRAERLDLQNRRRLIRALEIVAEHGHVPERVEEPLVAVEWEIINPERDILRERIDARLARALERGLIEEVRAVRAYVGDTRLNELGLEYRVVGEFLRGERDEESLLPTLHTKLWHYARHQKAWLRKLT